MPGLVPGSRDFYLFGNGVNGRDKPGRDAERGLGAG